MLADIGASVVIVGHSERREGFGESDADVRAKAEAALAAGLSVILCVGEPREVRESGGAIDHVLAQVAGSVPDDFDPHRLAIAYEPIWAIGTGLVPTVADVAAMHGAIRGALAARFAGAAADMRILYGGSVNGENAAELLGADDVDGALVGGASLTAAKFLPIVEAACGALRLTRYGLKRSRFVSMCAAGAVRVRPREFGKISCRICSPSSSSCRRLLPRR